MSKYNNLITCFTSPTEIKVDNKDLIYKISQGFDITIDNEIQNYIANSWDTIQEKAEKIKKNKEELDMLAVQGKNRRLRNLVKHVHWSGNTCIVYWNDGSYTKSHWNPNEAFDPEKAILVCMARKLYENTNIYNEVLKKYEDDGYLHHFKYHTLGLEND